jgi:hypothetical protein
VNWEFVKYWKLPPEKDYAAEANFFLTVYV